jgi:hypothetical protein
VIVPNQSHGEGTNTCITVAAQIGHPPASEAFITEPISVGGRLLWRCWRNLKFQQHSSVRRHRGRISLCGHRYIGVLPELARLHVAPGETDAVPFHCDLLRLISTIDITVMALLRANE